MAVIDLGNIRVNWRGPYQSEIDYVKDDVVSCAVATEPLLLLFAPILMRNFNRHRYHPRY